MASPYERNFKRQVTRGAEGADVRGLTVVHDEDQQHHDDGG